METGDCLAAGPDGSATDGAGDADDTAIDWRRGGVHVPGGPVRGDCDRSAGFLAPCGSGIGSASAAENDRANDGGGPGDGAGILEAAGSWSSGGSQLLAASFQLRAPGCCV